MKYGIKKTLSRSLLLALAALVITQVLAADAPANVASQGNVVIQDVGGKPNESPEGLENETWTALTENSGASGQVTAGCYYLQDDVALVECNLTIPDGATVNLHLNGHTLSGAVDSEGNGLGSVITVGDGATLNLYDNTGSGATGDIRGGVGTDYYGETRGGGVYVDYGTLHMYGGTMKSNVAENSGGVYVNGNGTFTMEGGNIQKNTSDSLGGGVYVNSNATFTMNGGSITYNTATTQHGGGVYVQENATFIMNGGTIIHNDAQQHGGGVYVNKADFTMTKGDISYNLADGEENKSEGNGGGLFLNSAKSVTVDGDGEKTFSHNQARNGGGIYITNGEDDGLDAITMDNITVTNNKAIYNGTVENTTSNGSGIYVMDLGDFTLTNSTIENNTAADNGGGVYLKVNTVTLTNNRITDNKSTAGSGGGVYLTGFATYNGADATLEGTLTMTCNTILNNTAGIAGGGGYIKDYGTVTLNGNTISNNIAESEADNGHGGGLYVFVKELSLTGDEITGNETKLQGGGLYVDKPANMIGWDATCTFTMTDATITGNKAKLGGGICSAAEQPSFSGTVTVIDNTDYKDAPNNVAAKIDQTTGEFLDKLSITGTLDKDSRIGFTQTGASGEDNLFMELEDGASASGESFSSDSDAYKIVAKTESGKTIGYYFEFVDKDSLFAGGDGTAETPYEIATAAQLQTLGNFVNNATFNAPDKYYVLTNDIVLDKDYVFFHMKAHLDGNGKTISGAPTTGVFNIVANGATLKNLKLNFTSENIEPADYFGSLARQTQGGATIENCHNLSDITIPSDKAINHAGGLVGIHLGEMSNCSNAGNLSSPNSVGGLVGVLYDIGKVEKCYNTGSVFGSEIAGGIIGENKGHSISNCYNVGKISGQGIVGGVIGSNNIVGTITSVYHSGTLSGSTVGGVVGSDDGTGIFTNCYYVGEADSTQKGTALSRSEMTGNAAKTNMTGFDFDSVWYVNPLGTPTLTENPIASIAVSEAPSQITYAPGETFNPAGLVLEATTIHGENGSIPYAGHEEDFAFDPDLETKFTEDDMGDITVTITYLHGCITTQTITIRTPSTTGSSSKPKEDTTQVKPSITTSGGSTSATVEDKDLENALGNAVEQAENETL